METKIEEIWKDVVGYEGLYRISSIGRILSCDKRKGNGRGFILKQRIMVVGFTKCGYPVVGLCKDKKTKKITIHRLVATAFIPNLSNKATVNHKDGNKLNNHISNLEWMTVSENLTHAWRTGLKTQFSGSLHPKAKKVYQYSLDGALIRCFDCIQDAVNEYNNDTIRNCLCGTSKTASGFIWKYNGI